MYKDFTEKLCKLCEEHGVALSGTLWIREDKDFEPHQLIAFMPKNSEHAIDSIRVYRELKSKPLPEFKPGKAAYVYDADAIMGDGIKSMADGKRYTSRRDYSASLRARGYIEMGDQTPTKANTEIRGDFNVRKELHQAIQQHLG